MSIEMFSWGITMLPISCCPTEPCPLSDTMIYNKPYLTYAVSAAELKLKFIRSLLTKNQITFHA